MRPVRRLRERLARRPDSEFEQALFRLALGTVLVGYILFNFETVTERGLEIPFVLWVVLFYGAAGGVIARICMTDDISPTRRIVGACVDAACITASMHFGGESAAAFFLAYVWVTLGNGFRYGSDYLLISLVMSVAGFASTIIYNPFWREHQIFGWEMLIGMIGIALYARMLVIKLNRATQRAEAANEAKRAFVSRMSHEMRTPLTSILGLAELLAGTRLAADQRQMAGLVRESSLHLKSLVDDILDFSKIEAGKMVLEEADLNVRALVWTVAGIVSPQARGKGLRLDLHLAPEVPERIVSDEVRLRQVLLNLAGNAVKFTRTGSVTIGVAVVDRHDKQVTLRFSVEDTGIGIPADKIARIFESFTQADEGVTRRYGGTGLGTTIAKQLVDLMGGRMEVTSEVGKGSVFAFEIPVEAVGPGTASEVQADAPSWMLVGFEAGERDDLGRMLASWGVQVVDAASESSAAPSARLSGVFLRHDDARAAATVIRGLRGDPRVGTAPVILCTRDRGLIDAAPDEAAATLAMPLQRFDVFSSVHLLSTTAGAREALPTSDAAATDAAGSRRAFDILVIDDTATNRFVIKSILDRAGHRCEAVAAPGEGLDRFVERSFQVVVCDRNMPEMDGIDLVRQLRALDASGARNTGVVMLTGDATSEARDAAMQAGVDEFLTKPVRPAELLEALGRVAARRKLVAGSGEPAATTTGSNDDDRAASPAADQATGRGAASVEAPKAGAADARRSVINDEAVAALAQLRPDDPWFVRRLQARFLDDARGLQRDVVAAIERGDIAVVKDAIHTLEGDAGSLGLDGVSSLCRAHRGLVPSDLGGAARHFAVTLASVLEETQAALPALPTESTAGPAARS